MAMHANTRHLSNRARAATLVAIAAAAAIFLLLALGAGSHASASTASASRSETVTIKNFQFKPGTLNIDKGDRVVWANLSDVKHTATGAGFDTGTIRPGKAVAVKFGSKGTYRYHCTIHPDMTGKIVVG